MLEALKHKGLRHLRGTKMFPVKNRTGNRLKALWRKGYRGLDFGLFPMFPVKITMLYILYIFFRKMRVNIYTLSRVE